MSPSDCIPTKHEVNLMKNYLHIPIMIVIIIAISFLVYQMQQHNKEMNNAMLLLNWVEEADVALIITDLDSTIISANKTARELLNRDPLAGVKVVDIIPNDYKERHRIAYLRRSMNWSTKSASVICNLQDETPVEITITGIELGERKLFGVQLIKLAEPIPVPLPTEELPVPLLGEPNGNSQSIQDSQEPEERCKVSICK